MEAKQIKLIQDEIKRLGTVWAWDPGEDTGVVGFKEGVQMFGQTVPYEELPQFFGVSKLAYFVRDSTFIVEDYLLKAHGRGGTAFDKVIGARVIGMLELVAYQNCVKKLEYQRASDAKNAATTEVVRAVFGKVGGTRHETDALRHVVWYALRSLTRVDKDKARAVF